MLKCTIIHSPYMIQKAYKEYFLKCLHNVIKRYNNKRYKMCKNTVQI